VDRGATPRGAVATTLAPEANSAAGLYGPTSEAWRLNREAMLLLGAGPRALLLQVAHPLVAEGVDQHSDFRADPWRRLLNTLRSYLAIVYGTAPRARAEIRRLNALHHTIGGPVRDAAARAAHGATYRARDPELSMWVHATLVDSTIVANDCWIAPLSRDRRARFYEETRPIGRALGIPDDLLPADLEAFETYVAGRYADDGPVHPSPTARAIAAAILSPPLGPVVPALGWLPARTYRWTFWPAIGLLPEHVRREYGFEWGPLERAVSAWLVAGWRAWRPIVPTTLRWLSQARAADRRG
jgi:uncharacterized protein (DUF2236 family)